MASDKNNNNKNKNKYKRVVALLILMSVTLVDIVPLMGYAVDIKSNNGEVNEEQVVEIEDEGIEKELEDEDEKEEEDTNETHGGIQTTSMEGKPMAMSITNNENKYVLANDSDFSGTTNGNFRYIGNYEYVEIPHKIKGVNVTSYERMFQQSGVKGVKSTNTGVTNMSYMFHRNDSGTLYVSELDTSGVTSMVGMFSGVDGGQNKINNLIGLENFNTSNVTSMASMFSNSDIDVIDVSSFNTSNVTEMTRMFHVTTAKEIKGLDSFDTSRVGSMSSMFGGTRTQVLDVSSFDTSNVVNMSSMFHNSSAREIIGLENFDTSKVTNMSGMLRSSKADELDVRSFDTSNVLNMNSMFESTSAKVIKGLDILNTSKVIYFSRMFYNSSVTDLDLTNFNTMNATNMSEMFTSSEARELDLSSFNTEWVQTTKDMFYNSKAETITFGNLFKTKRVEDMSYMFARSKAKELDLSMFDTSKVTTMDSMFNGAEATTIKGLGTFNTVNVTNMGNMFNGAKANQLDVSNLNTNNVDNMVNMFKDSHAEELDLSNFRTFRITDMGSMFEGAKAKRIDISNFDTTSVYNMNSMFKNTELNELDLSSFDMVSVNDTDDMFTGSKSTIGLARSSNDAIKLNTSKGKPDTLTFNPKYSVATDEDFSGTLNGYFKYIGDADFIEIPHTIKGINVNNYKGMFSGTSVRGVVSTNPNVTDMSYMFEGNTATDLDIRGLNTENASNMEGMFKDTKAIKVDLSNMRTINVTNMTRMFENAHFKELDLGSFDTERVTNFNNMFKNVKATVGYARSVNDLNNYNNSSGKPSNLNFTVWSITTEQTPTDWTNESVSIEVISNNDQYDIDFIEMINGEGRNELLGSHFDNGQGQWKMSSSSGTVEDSVLKVRPYGGNIDYTYIYTNMNLVPGETYTLSMRHKNNVPLNFRGGVNVSGYGGTIPITNKWEVSHVTFKVTKSDVILRLYFGMGHGHNSSLMEIDWMKLEKGRVPTPWTLSPEDMGVEGNSKEYQASVNGSYIFRVTDTGGYTKTVAHTVSNIDTTQPYAEITPSTTGWTSQDVTLYVIAEDDLSGVRRVELPDGNIIEDEYAEYVVKDNGTYTFKITDKAGNTSTVTEEVSNIDRSVPKITTTIDNTSWTRDPINITVTSEESASGLIDIDMVRSPYTPAPEDIKLVNNSKTYPVVANGMYTFEATYNNGATSEVSVNVTNIDREKPEISVLDNPKDWVEDEEITLNIKATDTLSGVKSITLPDGSVINGDTATYKVSENGEYEFTVIDNIGNITTHTETVEYLMIPYNFYVYYNNGNPIKGSEFELLRNSERYKRATSDKDGLVDFGKIPPVGQYTIRQISSGDGVSVIPGDIEVEDPTDPVEIINYPRGTEMPSTGTRDYITYGAIIVVLLGLITIYNRKRNE